MKKFALGALGVVSVVVCSTGCSTVSSDDLNPLESEAQETESADSAQAMKLDGVAEIADEGDDKQAWGNVPFTLRPGLFGIAGGTFSYSNGSAYCNFGSWEDFVAITGRNSVHGIPVFDGAPRGMAYHGACQFRVSAGFFRVGFGFYSNGAAYCSCDRTGAPGARVVHRRPDMPYHGSCGGC